MSAHTRLLPSRARRARAALCAAAAAALLLAATPSLAAASAPHIAILHMYDGASFFRRLGDLTGANKLRYAQRHGYDYVLRSPDEVRGLYRERVCPDGKAAPCWEDDPDFRIDGERKATFGKLKLAMAACNNRPGAWLLWSDADALIVNQTQPLEAIVDDGYDIMVAYDWLMLQAGVILFKCSPFTIDFLHRVYDDRSFDNARALDQSALQAYIDKMTPEERDAHVKFIPKHSMNVYLEEYRAGDFLVHMAGKLYEATEPGLWAIANQLDIFSIVEDVKDIDAFLSSRYFLNRFSGVCPVSPGEKQSSCTPSDPRRFRLKEPLGAMSTPDRYRHVGMRYYFLPAWKDQYDVPGWNKKRKELPLVSRAAASATDAGAKSDPSRTVPPVFPGAPPAAETGHATAPHIQLVKEGAPRHGDATKRDSGTTLPLVRTTPSWTRIGAYVFMILGLGGATLMALKKRDQRQSLKQR
jgi:hypothetical protein